MSARELSLAEIKEIRDKIPKISRIETFIHGAMCISYSGRCLLSNYFTGRDANQGACTHPCRWKYAVVEENVRESICRSMKMSVELIFSILKTFV